MKLLNSKSVINCIDSELENHAKESEEILKNYSYTMTMIVLLFLNTLMQFIKMKSQS